MTADLAASPEPRPGPPAPDISPRPSNPTEVPSNEPIGIPQPGPDIIDPGVAMPSAPGQDVPGLPGAPGMPTGPGIV